MREAPEVTKYSVKPLAPKSKLKCMREVLRQSAFGIPVQLQGRSERGSHFGVVAELVCLFAPAPNGKTDFFRLGLLVLPRSVKMD